MSHARSGRAFVSTRKLNFQTSASLWKSFLNFPVQILQLNHLSVYLSLSHALLEMRMLIKAYDKNWTDNERAEILHALDIYVSEKKAKTGCSRLIHGLRVQLLPILIILKIPIGISLEL